MAFCITRVLYYANFISLYDRLSILDTEGDGIKKMITIAKYDKNGKSERKEFDKKLSAMLWLADHLEESEWCWVMYMKDGDKT